MKSGNSFLSLTIIISLTLFSSLTLVSCGGGGGGGGGDTAPVSSASNSDSASISSGSSGELTLSSGMKVKIPAGAVPEGEGSATFSAEQSQNPPAPPPDGMEACGDYYEVNHDGDSLAQPVGVSMPSPCGEVGEDSRAMHYDEEEEEWQPMGFSKGDDGVDLSSFHFSWFAVMKFKTPQPETNWIKIKVENTYSEKIWVVVCISEFTLSHPDVDGSFDPDGFTATVPPAGVPGWSNLIYWRLPQGYYKFKVTYIEEGAKKVGWSYIGDGFEFDFTDPTQVYFINLGEPVFNGEYASCVEEFTPQAPTQTEDPGDEEIPTEEPTEEPCDTPDAPSVTATSGDTQGTISVSWALDPDATTYYIYYGDTPGGPYTGTEASAGSSPVNTYGDNIITLSGLVPELTYYIVVTAENECGESPYSTEASALSPEDQVPVQSEPAWAKSYGLGSLENFCTANAVVQTSDGGYIVAGTVTVVDAQNNYWVIKLDAFGSVTWEKTYGGAGYEAAQAVQQTTDGGYIVAGSSNSYGVYMDAWILKLDSSGNITWQKTYGGSIGNEMANAVQLTSGGGYVIAGSTQSFSSNPDDFWMFEIDSDGDIIWEEAYDNLGFEVARAVQQTSDGGFIIGGSSSSTMGDNNLWIIKTNSTGTTSMQREFDGEDYDNVQDIIQTSDGGYILVGDTMSFGAGSIDICVIKLDSSGTVSWEKAYGGANTDIGHSIVQTSDGGYVIGGITMPSLSFNPLILKLASNGSIEWQKMFTSLNGDEFLSIQQTADGGYIAAGLTGSYSSVTDEVAFWIVKTQSDGTITNSCPTGLPDNASLVTEDTEFSYNDYTPAFFDTTASVSSTSAVPVNTSATVMTQCTNLMVTQ